MRAFLKVYMLLAICALVALTWVVALPVFAAEWATDTVPAARIAPAAGPAKTAPAASKSTASAPVQKQAAAQAQAQSQSQAAALPQSIYLVRSTLLALNDANRTGNYTVLRDLAAPSIRDRTSAADLGATFSALRKTNIDLAVAALMTPEFAGPPMLDDNRRMHLKGEFATTPNRIVFELTFEPVNAQWMLSDVSISTRPATRTAANGPAR